MNPESRELRFHSTLLLAAGAAYLGWWFFVRAALPDAFNPLGSRLVVVACFFAVYAASRRWPAVARTLDRWLALCCAIATAHYFYLFDRNHTDLNWLVGSYITVTAVCAILQTSRSLLFYSLFVTVLAIALLLRRPGISYVVFLPGLLTNLVLANVGLHSRLRVTARLRESLRERSRAEAALVRANRDLESFSYSVAHDLRSPLRSINGFSRMLLDEYGGRLDDDGKRHLERIAAAAGTMAHLIDALLELAHLARRELRRQRVDLTELVDAVAKQIRAREPDRVVELENQEGVVGHGDPELLRALLDNLLANAWKFTVRQPSPRVAFACRDEAGVPVYSVRDNGAGFDMAHAKKLFGPFQRLHSAAEYPGTGIGLATVHRIVERHGGRVWAEGTVNGGATFCFTLQADPARERNVDDGDSR